MQLYPCFVIFTPTSNANDKSTDGRLVYVRTALIVGGGDGVGKLHDIATKVSVSRCALVAGVLKLFFPLPLLLLRLQ